MQIPEKLTWERESALLSEFLLENDLLVLHRDIFSDEDIVGEGEDSIRVRAGVLPEVHVLAGWLTIQTVKRRDLENYLLDHPEDSRPASSDPNSLGHLNG